MRHPWKTASLLTATAVAGLLGAATGFAQDTETGPKGAEPQPPQNTNDEVLGEIIVTATRHVDTVDKVPLSITALTGKALEAQSINTLQDVTRAVPGLTLRYTDNNALNPEIRGIVSTDGAPTTGVYLDDTALQKRSGGGLTVGNGTPFPPLFDLEASRPRTSRRTSPPSRQGYLTSPGCRIFRHFFPIPTSATA